jgi:hypothetical protein
MIDHIAVSLEHTAPRIVLGYVYHFICPLFDRIIKQPVRLLPPFGLIAARQSKNQLHLRVIPPRVQYGLRRKRIEAQGAASVKYGHALLQQAFNSLLQTLLQVGKFIFWNFSMAGKTATLSHRNLSP